MIVKNEAATLPRCLQSVQGWVDEMVVLDTGSTDETIAIAQALGAKVQTFPWSNDFAAARNQALKFVEGDWVLVLDADEVLVPEIKPQLHQAIQQPDYLVINLMREEVGAQQSPFSMVSRLFRRHPEIHFSRPYHALIDDSVAALQAREPRWQIGYVPAVAIRHDGYHPEAIAQGNKQARAQAAMESFLAQHPQDAYVCSKLGALYVQMGQTQAGLALLQRGLSTQPQDPGTRYELHYHLGTTYGALGETAVAQQHYQAALQQPLPDLLKMGASNNWANLRLAQGDLEGARRAYERLVKLHPTLAIAHYNLGLTLKAMGDLPGAIAAYEQAIQLNPHAAEAHQNLGVALLKQGQLAASLEAFRQAIALHEHQNPTEAQRLRQGLQELGLSIDGGTPT